MPIYEFYCAENHTVYQFYAKTLAQGKIIPKCPDNPAFSMRKLLSKFAVTSPGKSGKQPSDGDAGGSDHAAEAEDPRMAAAMNAMESEFARVDENDPRAMGRMMRRMAELTGEKIDGEMEEVVRKLEEGADPDSLEEQLGGGEAGENDLPGGDEPSAPGAAGDPKEGLHRFRARRDQPVRDPRLYDYE
jgi:hypothetical protein